ncbi:TPA: hypothetical protein IVN29_003052 [Enterococcus faecium]|nr:hypothetical protein [Enterococcus faecium]
MIYFVMNPFHRILILPMMIPMMYSSIIYLILIPIPIYGKLKELMMTLKSWNLMDSLRLLMHVHNGWIKLVLIIVISIYMHC